MKMASTYLIRGKVFMQAYSQTTEGIWISDGPVCTVDATEFNELSKLIRSTLRNSRQNIPHPGSSQWKIIQQPLLAAVGARSWKAMAKSALAVGVKCNDDIVTFTPVLNYKHEGGESYSEDFVCPLYDENIGSILIDAYKKASL